MGTNLITDNEFYCVICKNRGLPVIRRRGKERGAGHLKKLFCIHCGKETNHAECRPWSGYTKEDFDIECKYHNFDENGNRIRPYGELRSLIYGGKI